MIVFNLSRTARSRIASKSLFCCAVVTELVQGQSMFATVATQTPRISRIGFGGSSDEGMYEVAKENNGAETTNALTEKRLQRQAPSAKLLRSSIHKKTKGIGSPTAIGWR